MNKIISEILQKLNISNNIGIISHIRPDGDTVGSGVALYLMCKKLGKNAELFCEDPVMEKLLFISDADKYQNKLDAKKFDCLVAIDCGDLGRLGSLQYEFLSCQNTINIDHHINSNASYAKINLVLNYAATAEIIYEIIKVSGVETDKEIATALYTAISTDTGNFQHNSTNKHTFECAKNLVEHIGDVNKICDVLYRGTSVSRFKLLGDVLNSAHFFEDNKIVILAVTFDKLNKSNSNIFETEGFVDHAINVIGCEVGICMTQTKERLFKVSFRSKGTVDVFKIANVFGGGGHKFAAACQICGDLYEILDKLVREVQFYL